MPSAPIESCNDMCSLIMPRPFTRAVIEEPVHCTIQSYLHKFSFLTFLLIRTGEMAQQWRALFVLLEDSGSISSIQIASTTICSSRPRGSDTLFWVSEDNRHIWGTQTYIQAKHSYTYSKTKICLCLILDWQKDLVGWVQNSLSCQKVKMRQSTNFNLPLGNKEICHSDPVPRALLRFYFSNLFPYKEWTPSLTHTQSPHVQAPTL